MKDTRLGSVAKRCRAVFFVLRYKRYHQIYGAATPIFLFKKIFAYHR